MGTDGSYIHVGMLAASIVHSKLAYCNYFSSIDSSQITNNPRHSFPRSHQNAETSQPNFSSQIASLVESPATHPLQNSISLTTVLLKLLLCSQANSLHIRPDLLAVLHIIPSSISAFSPHLLPNSVTDP